MRKQKAEDDDEMIEGQMSFFPEMEATAKKAGAMRKRKPKEEEKEPKEAPDYDEDSFPMNRPAEEPAPEKKEEKQEKEEEKADVPAEEADSDADTTVLHWHTQIPDAFGEYLCEAHSFFVMLYYFPEGPHDGKHTEPGWYGDYPGAREREWHFVKPTEISRWAKMPEK